MTGSIPPGVPRRGLLRAGAALATATVSARAATVEAPPDVPPWMQEQGAPLLTPPYGVPSPFEAGVVRRVTRMPSIPSVGSSLTPLQDLHGIITPGGMARQFAFVMEVKSVITAPSGGQSLGGPGFHEVRGLAWSGRGRVTRVEVSVDGGANWQEAALQGPILPKCLVRFRLPWRWDGAAAMLCSRATDETGAVQPTRDALLAARGTNAHYHYNAIHGWRLAADGRLTNAA